MHAYDPHCYCSACCSHEQRVSERIAAEERKLRERRELAAAYVADVTLTLAPVGPLAGRR